VAGSVIQDEEVEAVSRGGGEALYEHMKTVSLEAGEFQKEAPAGGGFDGSIEIRALEAILDRIHR
jgi:hypothetical protein